MKTTIQALILLLAMFAMLAMSDIPAYSQTVNPGGGGGGGSSLPITCTGNNCSFPGTVSIGGTVAASFTKLEARSVSGVDCTGATDSSTALNALTTTANTSGNKTLTFRGCPFIRLDNTWLIHGQESLEIDLGGTSATGNSGTSSSSKYTNTIIFGCNGTAGPLIQIDRSGNTYIHGGAITPGTSGFCSSSSFTGAIQYTNSGSGGFTSTQNKLTDIEISPSLQGTTISGFYGIYINGQPNQEGYKFVDLTLNCNNSPGSYGLWVNDANADSTIWERGNLTGCYYGVKNDSGVVKMTHAVLSGNGNYAQFGSGGATLLGPISEFSNNVVSDNSGTLQIPNSGNFSGGVFSGNLMDIISGSVDPAHYFIDIGSATNTLTLSSNRFVDQGGQILDKSIVGSVYADANTGGVINGTLSDLGGNDVSGSGNQGLVISSNTWASDFNSQHTVFFSVENNNVFNSGGSNAGFAMLPHGVNIPTASNTFFGQTSAPFSFFTPWSNGTSVISDRYVWQSGGYNKTSGTSTLVLNHVSPAGLTITPSLAIGVPLSGLQTQAVETPIIREIDNVGTAGSTTYSYVATALGGFGESTGSSTVTTNTGNASLSGTNNNRVWLYPTGGAYAFKIYRTAGGASQGLIGTVQMIADQNSVPLYFFDTGLVASGSVPVTNTADGSINLASGAKYKIAGTQISSSNLSDGPFSNNPTQINGTSIPTNSAADQAIVTTSPSSGSWAALPACLDSGGNHLNYNTSTHAFSCGNTGGSVGSVAFSGITGSTNVSAAMICGTGCSLGVSGTGTNTATSVTATQNATASNPLVSITGSIFTGGTGTTTQPLLMIQPSPATNMTNWSTNGTILGINLPTGFSGNMIHMAVNGSATAIFRMDQFGEIFTGSHVFIPSGSRLQVGSASLASPTANAWSMFQGSTFSYLDLGPDANTNFLRLAVTSQANPILNLLDANGGSTAQLQVSGTQATGTGDVNVCWTTAGIFTKGAACGTSLARYKTNIAPLVHGLDYIMQMRPVTFTWKYNGQLDLGMIADEVASLDPLLGAYKDDGELYNFRDRAVLATLIKAVQQIEDQVKELQRQQRSVVP